jgi:uncharacterized membrane protein
VSLESGRKLGLTASIIAVILPVIAVAVLASFIFSAIALAIGGSSIGSGIAFTASIVAFGIAIIAIGIAEFILFVVAMHRLSSYYKEPAIFKNILNAILVGVITIVVVVIMYILFFVFTLASVSQVTNPYDYTPPAMFSLSFLVIPIVSIVLGIVSAVFVYRAFTKLGEKSEVDSFKTAGLLYLVGVVIPFVGSIIAWIGWIFAAIGFHRLKPITPISYQTTTPQPTLPTTRCPYCSTENVVGATYCRFCGKPLQ